METLLLILVFFVVHLAVVFGIVLVISGLTSLAAVAGFGGQTAMSGGEDEEQPRRMPRILGALGVVGAILTAATLAGPLFFGEHLVSPYLDGLHERGGPEVTLDDASFNIAGGRLRSDGLRLRQNNGAYRYDVGVDSIEARLSPIAALGSTPRVSSVELSGVQGWVAPGEGAGESVTSPTGKTKAFYLGEFILEDVKLDWKTSTEDDPVGTLRIETWRTENIDHRYTLLDLLGRTNARGTFLDGELAVSHELVDETHRSRWSLDEMSLSKAGAAVGGPMKFVKAGTFTLDGRATWDDEFEAPATFAFDANLRALEFGPAAGDDSTRARILGALSDAISDSLPEDTRSLNFSFSFELSPETLQNAQSLYEYDVWKEIEGALKQAIMEEIGL